MADVLVLRPCAVVLHANGFVLEFEDATAPAVEAFTLPLGSTGQGVVEFVWVPLTTATYQSSRWLSDPAQALGPPASVPGVLWSRQAAREAVRDIASFQVLGGLNHESA